MHPMMTRREVLGLLGSISAGTLLATPRKGVASVIAAEPNASPTQGDSTPPLAPGAPTSPARTALIDAFRKKSDGIDARFEARTHKSDWVMPYRLFRPEAAGKLPLVIYLHGGGGLGGDNVKQMGSGNIFGTRVWALPEHQQRFPCYIVAPQTDRGWVRYAPANPGDAESRVIPGLGDGTRVALELIGALHMGVGHNVWQWAFTEPSLLPWMFSKRSSR